MFSMIFYFVELSFSEGSGGEGSSWIVVFEVLLPRTRSASGVK